MPPTDPAPLPQEKWQSCKVHHKCRKVRGTGHVLESVTCPWCGYPVSTSNPYQWCANCYVMFRLDGKFVHFSECHMKTEAEIWARALAKSGGARIGRWPVPEPVPDENGHVHDWQLSERHSDIYVARYTCECGARGYRERHTNLRGKRSQRVDLLPKPIKEYTRDGKQYHARFPKAQPEVTRKPRSAGRNRTGGYLPPSSGGKR